MALNAIIHKFQMQVSYEVILWSLSDTRHFRNREREYLKDRIGELATNSKNKNIKDLQRGSNNFKWGYQCRSNLVKDENGDVFADSHSISNRWKNYFSQILIVHRISDVRQIEIHTAEPLVPESNLLRLKLLLQS
jgi:hypothetical protein